MFHRLFIFIICLAGGLPVWSRPASPLLPHQIDPPMHIPLLMSGNFGELRKNHFHSGIDLKTQGTTGKRVYSIDEGYISRISVSPYGYGKAVYIDHPGGITTVYGHLNRFTHRLDSLVKARQYEAESFRVDLSFAPNELPVKRGELIAFSGNTGSSGGPHLHFEIRDTRTEEPLNPLSCFRHLIKDSRKPGIKSLMIYPIAGAVNGSSEKKRIPVNVRENGTPYIADVPTAWGEIALGLKAYDYMDGTTNIYGLYSLELRVDSQEIFSFRADRFSFDESRYLNSLIDYEEYAAHRSFFIKTYIEPGNRLRMYTTPEKRSGTFTIDEERDYRCVLTLRDIYHNTTTLRFTVRGKKQAIPAPASAENRLSWKQSHTIREKDMQLDLPEGALYDDLAFRYERIPRKKDSPYLSDIHSVHDPGTPLHLYSTLAIRITEDTLANKNQYYLVKIDKEETPVGGTYKDGIYTARIREFGKYAIRADRRSPAVVAVEPAKWIKNGTIRYRIGDDESGIGSFRGEIDGKYVLFEQDGKSSVISYRIDKERLTRGKKHDLKLTVTDWCGNEKEVRTAFTW